MVFSPEKDQRWSATVETAFATARALSGVQNAMNPKLVSSLVMQPFAMMAMATALNVVVMKQFSRLMLAALDGDLDSDNRANQNVASPAVCKAVEPAVRIVVDNSAREDIKSPKLKNPTALGAKPAKPAAKSATVWKTVDDLKRISGIGPKLEKVLKDKGLTGFSDIAKLSIVKAEALDRELGLSGRIKRDQWVEKAQALLKEQA